MARLERCFLPDQPLHIIQRGNNRQPIFFCRDDYLAYRNWLTEAAAKSGCAIHGYVLMTNHVHVLVTPETKNSIPRAMQLLGRRFVRYINGAYKRSGTLWEGRYRAAPIDSENYLLACLRYIELNPVRAGMVVHPRDYPWSSYQANAHGRADALITPHALYRTLGRSLADRQQEYRALFRVPLEAGFVDGLRSATNGGWAFGDKGFKIQIAKTLKRRVEPLPPGPQPKIKSDKRQMSLL